MSRLSFARRAATGVLALAAASPARGSDVPPASPPLAAPAPGPRVAVPVGIPITLDGRIEVAEWSDGKPVPLPAGAPIAAVKQVRGTLLLAMRLGRRWEPPWRVVLYASAAAEPARYDAPGSVVIDLEPADHNRPHAFVQVREEAEGGARWVRRDGLVVVRFAFVDVEGAMEAAIPLSVLGAKKDGPPVRWVLGWSTPGRAPSLVTFPAGLEMGASASGPPRDMASTAGWASTAFEGAGAPAAFAATDWDAMVAADKELTERGEAAHRKVHDLLGTFDAAPGTEHMKVDAPVERDLLENLRWVAAREPWSHADGRAYAIGLWQTNRAQEAFGVLRTLASTAPPHEVNEDLHRAAVIGQDAERFDEAAALWETLAARLTGPYVERYRESAARVRATGEAHRKELAARRADDDRLDLPLVLLRTTRGDVVLRLLEDDCPEGVRHFVHLVEAEKDADGKPFYDGTRFHRVVAAGLAQGGDPRSRTVGCDAAGSGGSPWWVPAEKNARHAFFRGAVGWSMGLDRRVGSQFFVLTAPKPQLDDHGFSCFATVVGGMDVVDRLEHCDELISARVLRKRDHPYVPKKNPK